MPIYRVDRPGQEKPRIVESAQPGGARNHVAKSELKVTKIDAKDAFALAGQGIELETAIPSSNDDE